jgi:chromosome segregation ATPase
MQVMRESWTDERLDALNEKVDLRFGEVDRRFDEMGQRFDRVEGDIRELKADGNALRAEMKAGFDRVDERFESMHRMLLRFSWVMIVALVGLTASVIGLVAAKL